MKRFFLAVLLIIAMIFTEGCGMLSGNQAEELYQAIRDEDTERVRELAKNHRILNRPRETGLLMLVPSIENVYPLEAACYTSAELTEILLDEGADVNVVDPYISSTPLINALSAYYPERFRIAFELIERGADIDKVDENRRSALNACVMPSRQDTDEAREDQMRLLKYLLEHCDLKEGAEKSGTNALINAASFGNEAALEYIAAAQYYNVDDMPGGYTALMAAAGMGKIEVCSILLEYGADPYLRSEKGETAIDYALASRHPEVAEFLESRRASDQD